MIDRHRSSNPVRPRTTPVWNVGEHMSEIGDNETLSSGDALFIYLEREGMPLNVASVCIFDGSVGFDSFRGFIESKLPLIPRYLQRIVTPPFDLGIPIWQYDPDFDITNHVHHLVLKRGTDSELKHVAARLLSSNMDRGRPLWDLTLVGGLKGDRSAIIARVHHCLVDGVAGVALMNVMMDASPVAPTPPRKKTFTPPPPRDSVTQLLDGFITSVFSSVQRVLTAQADVLSIAQRISASLAGQTGRSLVPEINGFNGDQQSTSLADITRLLPEMLAPTQRLPFNKICRGPQRFSWTEIPLDDVKAVKSSFGTTLNNIFLSMLTDTIGRYVERKGVQTKGRLLRIIVPVNVRGDGKAGELGNRVTFAPVTVPLGIHDSVKLVAAVKERTSFVKSAQVAELIGAAGALLTTIPTAIQAFAGPIASQLPISVCNLICTNVPGPQMPLYLLGHKMLSWYPYVPIGGEMGLNCAVLTYNGNAFFGFSADVSAAPDVDCLPKFLQQSFDALTKAAGMKRKRRSSPVVKTAGQQRPRKKRQSSTQDVYAVPEPPPTAKTRA